MNELMKKHKAAVAQVTSYIYIYIYIVQKFGVSKIFFLKKLVLVFNKDALN